MVKFNNIIRVSAYGRRGTTGTGEFQHRRRDSQADRVGGGIREKERKKNAQWACGIPSGVFVPMYVYTRV